MAGAVHLFGPPPGIAAAIRRRVRAEIGLPISVGVARTKHLAKIASQVAKPDGLVVVEAGREREFLDPLPVELMWGVGPVTRTRLAGAGIRTIGQLAVTPDVGPAAPARRRGGGKLGVLAGNVDPRRIETSHKARSVGAQSALGSPAGHPGARPGDPRLPRRPGGRPAPGRRRGGRTSRCGYGSRPSGR